MMLDMQRRNFWIMLLGDILLVLLSYYSAYYLRFEGNIPSAAVTNFARTIWWIIAVKLLCFVFFDLYKGMWRYTSIYDLVNLVK